MSTNEQQFNTDQLVNDLGQNLLDPVVSNNIYWNSQNDENETFATLFANTLLHDDFTKETDFDCLGLDNLQLSYNSISNNLEVATNPNHSPPTNFNTNSLTSTINFLQITTTTTTPTDHDSVPLTPTPTPLQLTELQSLNINDTNDFIIISNETISELLPKEAFITSPPPLPPPLTQTSSIEEDDKVFKKPQIYFSSTQTLNLSSSSNENVDTISKLSSPNHHHHHHNHHHHYNHQQQTQHYKSKLKDSKTTLLTAKKKEKTSTSSSSSSSSNVIVSESLFSSLPNNNNNTNNNTSNSKLNFTSSMNKLLSLKRSRKRSKMLIGSGVNHGNSSLNAAEISENSGNNSNNNEDNSNFKGSSKKFLTIKQNKFKGCDSKKVEKLKQQMKQKSNNTTNNAVNSGNISSSSSNQDYLLNSFHLQSYHGHNFEPVTKKLAVDSNTANSVGATPEASLKLILSASVSSKCETYSTLNSKKDEVDLDIKELSLLDLHSSEDDSNEIFLKGKNALNQLKKNTRSSSSDNFYSLLNNSSTHEKNNNNNLNELLSKRIKYSPAVACGTCLSNTTQKDPTEETTKAAAAAATTTSSVVTSKKNNTDEDESSQSLKNEQDPHKESKINKFIQYLTKSLDSNSTSINTSSNNNSSNESLINIATTNGNSRNNKSKKTISSQKHESTSISSSLSSFNSNNSSCSQLSTSLNFKSQNQKRKKKDSSTIFTTKNNSDPLPPPPPPPLLLLPPPPPPQQSVANLNENKTLRNDYASSASSSLKEFDHESLINQLNLMTSKSFSLENDDSTVQYMKNLDINNDLSLRAAAAATTKQREQDVRSFESISLGNDNSKKDRKDSDLSSTTSEHPVKEDASSSSFTLSSDLNFKLNLNDPNSRKYLWNLLKSHSTLDELLEQFGSTLHNKVSFWDLVQLKLKYSKTNRLKTTYEIIDDYTLLYSNMSSLLEKIVNEHTESSSGKKNENSSRSRSSSRNHRKQSASFGK